MNEKKYSHIIKIGVVDKLIIIITFICLIATIVFSLSSYYKAKESQAQLVEISLREYAKESKTSLKQYLEYHYDILQYLTNFKEVNNMDWEQQYLFLNEQSKLLDFENFIVMDMKGNGYYADTNKKIDQSMEDFSKNVIKNKEYITDPYWQEEVNRSITTLSVSIYNNNEKVGALCGVIDLNRINEIFETKQVGKEGYSFLVDKSGRYIAHKNMEYVHHNKNIFNDIRDSKSKEFIRQSIFNKETLTGEIILNDRGYYISINPIEWVDWSVIFLLPKQEAQANLKPIVILQLMMVICSILIIGLGVKIVYRIIENHRLAYTDALTQINNRAAYDSVFEEFNSNYNSSISIITFDLNKFKSINDTYGHKSGDEILYSFAHILKRALGEIGFVARMGGDEFIAILTDKTTVELEIKLEVINQLVEEYNKDHKHKLGISYGYAIRNKGDKTQLGYFIDKADQNMYEFKNMRR